MKVTNNKISISHPREQIRGDKRN